MSLFDAFFLSMILVSGIAAIIVMGIKFFKDMKKEHHKDVIRNKAIKNSFITKRGNGTMAVRNK